MKRVYERNGTESISFARAQLILLSNSSFSFSSAPFGQTFFPISVFVSLFVQRKCHLSDRGFYMK